MTEKRGGGKGLLAVHGDTEREDSRVAVVVEPIDGDRGASKVNFSSNISLEARGGRCFVKISSA